MDDLPPLLLLNAAVYNEEHHRVWLNQSGSNRFLRAAVGLDLNTDPAQPGGLVGTVSSVSQPGLVVYELRVSEITGHGLVHLLNDFIIGPHCSNQSSGRSLSSCRHRQRYALCIEIDGSCSSSPIVPEADHSPEYFSPWFVFNDFAVKNVSEADALSFPAKWKVGEHPYVGTSLF